MERAYGADLMWNDSLLAQAESDIQRLQLNLARMEVAPTDSVINAVIKSLSHNLDTVGALNHIRTWMDATEAGVTGGEAGELSRALDTLLGLAP
jgi:L-cysteine:1D-myo-inositol 2-amino-2-deoxy-alpha-D-glucopyranoside ligase